MPMSRELFLGLIVAIKQQRSEVLKAGLDQVALHAQELGMLPFFGTLLGLVREGKPIEGDDDLDFLCPLHIVNKVVSDLVSTFDCQVRFGGYIEGEPYVATLTLRLSGHSITLDIFGYLEEKQALVLPANWFNVQGSRAHELRVPRKLVFPVRVEVISGTSYLFPRDAESTLAFLYGARWEEKLVKGVHYSTSLLDGTPVVKYHRGIRVVIGAVYKRLLNLTRFRAGVIIFRLLAPLRRASDSKAAR